jgi:hypothetical protein
MKKKQWDKCEKKKKQKLKMSENGNALREIKHYFNSMLSSDKIEWTYKTQNKMSVVSLQLV